MNLFCQMAHSHHNKGATNEKLDSMLQDSKRGRAGPFHCEPKNYGKTVIVTLSSMRQYGMFVGYVRFVQLKEKNWKGPGVETTTILTHSS